MVCPKEFYTDFEEEVYSDYISERLEATLSSFGEDTTEAVNIFTELKEELIYSGEQHQNATREEDDIIYSIDIYEEDEEIAVQYTVYFSEVPL